MAHYRWVEAKHSWLNVGGDAARNEWAALDLRYAVQTVKKLGELQGMYVKYGQTLAGLTNTFSLTWINEFRKLEDQVSMRILSSCELVDLVSTTVCILAGRIHRVWFLTFLTLWSVAAALH